MCSEHGQFLYWAGQRKQQFFRCQEVSSAAANHLSFSLASVNHLSTGSNAEHHSFRRFERLLLLLATSPT
jgi:hypothetical protein